MKRLLGFEAIDYAKQNGLRVNKFADPTEDQLLNVDVDAANKIALEDPRLIYIDIM